MIFSSSSSDTSSSVSSARHLYCKWVPSCKVHAIKVARNRKDPMHTTAEGSSLGFMSGWQRISLHLRSSSAILSSIMAWVISSPHLSTISFLKYHRRQPRRAVLLLLRSFMSNLELPQFSWLVNQDSKRIDLCRGSCLACSDNLTISFGQFGP